MNTNNNYGLSEEEKKKLLEMEKELQHTTLRILVFFIAPIITAILISIAYMLNILK